MIPIPTECYEQKNHVGATLVCEENRRRVVFEKPKGQKADKIKVDGCCIRQATACDYLVRDWKNRHHFVELKGRDVEHALNQLIATIPSFFEAGSQEEFWCFVASTGSAPAARPGIQVKKAQLKKAWNNAKVEIRTNECVHALV